MARLRDLEVCNEARKILARMMNKVLNEVCKDTIHATQQAFFSGRDILVNNVRMHTVFREWAARSSSGDQVLLLLFLDCSKGYNFLSGPGYDAAYGRRGCHSNYAQ